MGLRNKIGKLLRAGGGALNGTVYDRLAEVDGKLERLRQPNREFASAQASASPASSDPSLAQGLDPALVEKWEEIKTLSKLINAGFNPAVIYDIGAAEGEWSAAISTLLPRSQYHLFEPLAEVLPKFSTALEVQLRQHPNFTLHPVALGAQTGNIIMSLKADGVSSTVFDMGDHSEFAQRQEVPQWRLDDFVERHSLPLPNLIKVDAQAAEFQILSHAPKCLSHATLVLAETWFDRGYGPGTPLITEISALLDLHGYQLVEIGHRFYDDKHRLYGCDAIYLKRNLLDRLAPVLRSV